MAMRGMERATAAKSRYTAAPAKSFFASGNCPGVHHFSPTPKTQESKIPVKKDGTAMPSWFKAVRAPSNRCRPAEKTPRGMETRVIIKKLTRLKHSVNPIFGARISRTGCL